MLLCWCGLALGGGDAGALAAAEPAGAGHDVSRPFPPLYPYPEPFLARLPSVRPAPATMTITGVIVPHHLLAADMAARVFADLGPPPPTRIILLGPDHFRRSPTPIAVTDRDFATCLGPVRIDRAAVDFLRASGLAGTSGLFSHEHAFQAVVPWLARFFPEARLVPVAIRIDARPEMVASFGAVLAQLCGPGTLVVQSTDFSHHLPPEAAAVQDRATRAFLTGPEEPAAAFHLHQPHQIDSRAAMFLQAYLQKQVYRAHPEILEQRTARDYVPHLQRDITTYFTVRYRTASQPGDGPASR